MPTQAHGKKYRKSAEKRTEGQAYQSKQALELVKTGAFAKFDETVEVAVRLGGGPLHESEGAHDLLGHDEVAHLKVLDRSLRLGAEVRPRRHLHLAHRIGLNPVLHKAPSPLIRG